MIYPDTFGKVARLNTEIQSLKGDLARIKTESIRRQLSYQIRLKESARDYYITEHPHGMTSNTQPTEAHPSPQVRKAPPKPKKVKEKKPSGRRKRHEKGA